MGSGGRKAPVAPAAGIVESYHAAKSALDAAEAKGVSDRTMAKKWQAVFRAEDALKAAGMWC